MLSPRPSSGGGIDGGGSVDLPRLAARTDFFDTTEVRWFAEGGLPSALVSWFAMGPTTLELRRDRYRVDGSPDVGLKQRDRGPLEVKVRAASSGWIEVGGLRGRFEEWRKHLRVDESDVPGSGEWVEVDKVVLTRSYQFDADGGVRPVRRRSLLDPGCDVEIASITVDGSESWSFGLEAWGPTAVRRTVLEKVMDTFVGGVPLPAELLTELRRDIGYPEWLAWLTRAPAQPPRLAGS